MTTQLEQEIQIFKKGDKVIWDSHFGWDIGTFVQDNSTPYYEYTLFYNTVRIINNTAKWFHGEEIVIDKQEVFPYSEELAKQMAEKYGYPKKCNWLK